MWAALDWSYRLLTKVEQLLLTRLAVFAGGWTLEASEWVCARDTIPQGETIDLLASLAGKSLILVGEQRYGMLETIRQYAWKQLESRGEGDRMRRLHAEHLLYLAEAGRSETLAQADEEEPNVLAALTWLLTTGRVEQAVRLASATSGRDVFRRRA